MNPIVIEMLTNVHMMELQRQVEQQRYAEKAGYRWPWMTLPLTLAGLLVEALIGSGWIV
jgi:hypothetical protein